MPSRPEGPTLDPPSPHLRAERSPSGQSLRTNRRGLRPWRRHGRAPGGRPRSRPPACLASDRTSKPRQTGQAAQPRALSKGSSRPPSPTPVCAAGLVRVHSAVALQPAGLSRWSFGCEGFGVKQRTALVCAESQVGRSRGSFGPSPGLSNTTDDGTRTTRGAHPRCGAWRRPGRVWRRLCRERIRSAVRRGPRLRVSPRRPALSPRW